MPDARSPSLLDRWTQALRMPPRDPEPADMGTAFGMECSLGQDLPAAGRSASAAGNDPGWFQRWLARRS